MAGRAGVRYGAPVTQRLSRKYDTPMALLCKFYMPRKQKYTTLQCLHTITFIFESGSGF